MEGKMSDQVPATSKTADDLYSQDKYDLTGIAGAQHFRSLAVGLKLKLTDGATCEITANAGDGAYLMITITEDENHPDRVGNDEVVYFTEVQGVYLPTGSAS
jgi:hypothetical protein